MDFADVGQKRTKQGYGSNHSRTNGNALGNGFGGIADGIEVIHDCPGVFVETRHFADTVGIVRDRTKRVHRNRVAGEGQHPDTGE